MLHPNIRLLADHWRALKGEATGAPPRSAVDPSAFASLVGQTFVWGRQGPGRWQVRLAGELVSDLFGGEQRGLDALAPWSAPHRMHLSACLEAARRKGAAFAAAARGTTPGGRSAEFEILFAPLAASASGLERCLGLLQPTTPLAYLGAQPIARLELLELCAIDEAQSLPNLRLAVLDGRLIA
jgi:hypothetical protein